MRKFGIFDETVGMWIEKDTSKYQQGFTVCRPEQVECSWTDWGEAKKVKKLWKEELWPDHTLIARQIRVPSVSDEDEEWHSVSWKNEPEFPKEVTEDMLKTFLPTKEGSTRPLVGKIGEQKFIVKFDTNTNYEHVKNEIFADAFIRAAGFNAPLSRDYFVYSDKKSLHIRLAQYIEDCVSLEDAYKHYPYWNWEVKKQIVDAYPVVALMANVDAFHNDNVLVDKKGKVWFVDNGASFEFRAKGQKKEKATGFSYDWKDRTRCDDVPENGGMMGIYEYSDLLKKLLGRFTRTDVLRSIGRGVDLKVLVKSMPDEYRSGSLAAYASSMVEAAKEDSTENVPDHAWKYDWKFYDGKGTCPFDPEKDATAAFFWRIEHDIQSIDGREQIVEWLFQTSRPQEWPRFMQEATATRDELAVVFYAYETERRLRYGNPHAAMLHCCFGVEEDPIDWKRYFSK